MPCPRSPCRSMENAWSQYRRWSGPYLPPCRHQLGLEIVDAHAGLLSTDVLHVEAENAGKLGEVVDVAAGLDQLEHVARLDGRALLLGEPVFAAVAVLVLEKRGAVFRAVEGKAHAVERKAFLRLIPIEHGGAGNVLLHRDAPLSADIVADETKSAPAARS